MKNMSITLREYQKTAIDELLEWFENHDDGHPILEAAVGSGKSVMLAWLCQHALTTWPGTRIIMLVPQKELLEQNLEKLVAVWPDAPIGIHSASVGKKDIGHDILIATIGSLYKKAKDLGKVDLLLVDECHLIPGGKETGMYRKFIGDMHKYCPHMRVIGWTGTPFRGNGEWLTAVQDPLFTHIVSRVTMDDLLEQGFLSPLTTQETGITYDASNVGTSGGDYIVSQLAAAVDRPELVDAACNDIIVRGANRKKWLAYCVTVQHAEHVCSALMQRGIVSVVISAETPKAERAMRLAAFRSGQIRCIVNVAVLTTGFDVPDVDLIALLRNTKSPVLYVQIAGRGMRIAPEKTDCLWLDYTDTTELLGPVNKVKGRNKRKSNGEAPVKVCDECGSLNPISAKECSTCGTPFEIIENDPHRDKASAAAILSIGKKVFVTHDITAVTYSLHRKAGKPDSMKASYWDGMKVVANEWVCLEHDGYARDKAVTWWMKRARGSYGRTAPKSVSEALEVAGIALRPPVSIKLNVAGKYPEIVGYEWYQTLEIDDDGLARRVAA